MSSERIEQEPDQPAISKAVVVGLIAAVLFTIGGFWANSILRNQERELQPHGPLPTPAAIGSQEIGMVNQFLFEDDPEIAKDQRAQRARLESYGWIDPERGIVHIPIEKAMDDIAREVVP